MRVFPIDKYTLSSPRNNEIYDLIMKYMDDNNVIINDKTRAPRDPGLVPSRPVPSPSQDGTGR
jgi:hypothetical protein